MRKKQLLTYGLLAGAGYLLYQHFKTPAAPAIVVSAPGTQPTTVAGFGRLGYFPDGSDRPFAQHAGQYWRGRVR